MGHREEITIPRRGRHAPHLHAELPKLTAFINTFADKYHLDLIELKRCYDDTVLPYTGLPSRETVERNKFALNNYGDRDGDAYETLIIELGLERYHEKKRPVIKQRVLNELPTAYWREALNRVPHPDAQQEQADKPSWTKEMVPITCKEEYLHAIRHYLHLAAESIADRIDCHVSAIHSVERKESSALSHRANSVGPRLAAYYKKLSNRSPQPFFDSACYDALPTGLRSISNGARPALG